MFGEKCDRCQKGNENRWKGRRRAQRVRFIGGFHAILCPECENDWHLMLDDDPDWENLRDLQTRYECAVRANEVSAALSLNREYADAAKPLYRKSEQFVAEDVTRDEPDSDE